MRISHMIGAAMLTLALSLGAATPAAAEETALSIDAVPVMAEATAPASGMAQGFELFVFAGGGADALVQVASCPVGTSPQFWSVSAAGEFAAYDPATPDVATNAVWNETYPDGFVPAGSALLGRCS